MTEPAQSPSPVPRQFERYPIYRDSGVEWLGEIPAHWEIDRSKRLFSLRNVKASKSDRQLTASQEYGVIPQDEFMAREGRRVVQVITGGAILKHVEPNDFVISMRSFQGGIELSQTRGAISSAYVVLAPAKSVSHAYFSYLLKSRRYVQALQSTSNLVRDGQALRFENFSQVDLPTVPFREQSAIAAFLDRETARIDALVTMEERLIELLQEERNALVTRAVTKGLDADAEMQDAGVEWLGQIPAHWKVTMLKHAVARIADCPHETPIYSEQGEYFAIRTSDVSEGRLDIRNARRVDEKEYQRRIRRLSLIPDDIVYSREGERFGFAATVPSGIGACLGQRMMQFRAGVRWWPRFLMWQLNSESVRNQASVDIAGATSPHVNVETIRRFVLAEPPFAEQQAIAAFVDRETVKFDALVAKVYDAIDGLRELRAALITAAVTGKIDVRAVAEAPAGHGGTA